LHGFDTEGLSWVRGYEVTRLRGRRGHKDAEDMQVGRDMSIGKSDRKDEDVGLWRKRGKRVRGRYR
jgi:hypothetical protein